MCVCVCVRVRARERVPQREGMITLNKDRGPVACPDHLRLTGCWPAAQCQSRCQPAIDHTTFTPRQHQHVRGSRLWFGGSAYSSSRHLFPQGIYIHSCPPPPPPLTPSPTFPTTPPPPLPSLFPGWISSPDPLESPQPHPRIREWVISPRPLPRLREWVIPPPPPPRPVPRLREWVISPRPIPRLREWVISPAPTPRLRGWVISPRPTPRLRGWVISPAPLQDCVNG